MFWVLAPRASDGRYDSTGRCTLRHDDPLNIGGVVLGNSPRDHALHFNGPGALGVIGHEFHHGG